MLFLEAECLAFDKHTSGMSVKKKITFMEQQQCIYFFFLRLQEAAQTATCIYYSTQSVQLRRIELVLFSSTSKHKIVQQKQKTRSPVLVVKIQRSVSIC